MSLEGVVVPVVYPTGNLYHVDTLGRKRLDRFLQDAGITTKFVGSRTGEWYRMNEVQRFQWYKDVDLGSPLDVLLGITDTTLNNTMENTLRASRMPVKGLVVQLSEIKDVTPENALEWLEPILHFAGDKPVYGYEHPSAAERIITPDFLEKAAAMPGFQGVKLSLPYRDLKPYLEREYEPGFQIAIGDVNGAAPAFLDFAEGNVRTKPSGIVAGPANVQPRLWVSFWEALQDDPITAWSTYGEAIRAQIRGLEGNSEPQMFKIALQEMDILRTDVDVRGKPPSAEKRHYMLCRPEGRGIWQSNGTPARYTV